jgi:hypothetical protein
VPPACLTLCAAFLKIDGTFAAFACHGIQVLGQRGWSMRQLYSGIIRLGSLTGVAVLLGCWPASAACMSAMSTPQWPQIARSLRSAQLCEQIPIGPNHTAAFQVISVDVCSSAQGMSSIVARALLTCEAGSDSIVPLPPLEGEVVATVMLDARACMIRDANVQVSGDLGMVLSGLEETQQFARQWAQTQLSTLCRLR